MRSLARRGVALAAFALAACGGEGPARTPPASLDAGAGSTTTKPDAATSSSALAAVPRFRSVERRTGSFAIDGATRIAVDDTPETRAIGSQLARWLGLDPSAVHPHGDRETRPAQGIVLRRTGGAPGSTRDAAVSLPKSPDDEAYELDVSPQLVTIHAKTDAGLFYGAQALAQLARARRIGADTPKGQSFSVPCATIADAPRLRFRAMHLDVARHTFSRETIERYIDLLAFYRYNVFHWHLTDDQGFRFEVKGHPELTSVGGKDGYFTQDEARAVVEYARARFITVIPEIEMPGHARALLAAHPELSCTGKKQEVPRTWGIFDDVLCAGNEKTYVLLDDILREVAGVFPSSLVHIGGDEVPTTRWKACAKCRAAMRANHVSADALEGVFLRRIVGALGRLGKRPLVWDEALEGLAASKQADGASRPQGPAAPIIVAWQSVERGLEAAARGFDVVMAPAQHVYFNFHQSKGKGEPGHDGFLPWTNVRVFDPVPAKADPTIASRILGGEGTLWTEYVTTPKDIDVLAMPRVAALAESLWSAPAPSEDDFIARWTAQLPMLDASNVGYFVDPPVGAPERKLFLDGESVSVRLEKPRLFPSGIVRWTIDGSDPTAAANTSAETALTFRKTTPLATALFLPSGRSSQVFRSAIVLEEPRQPVIGVEATEATEPGVGYRYAEGDFRRLPEFDKIPVKARGRATAISLEALELALGGTMRRGHFAARFDGFVRAPASGVYRFVVSGDDGVRLEVAGTKLVDLDGEHELRTVSAEIALAAGLHPIRVAYFQAAEGKALDLEVEGPSLPLARPAVLVQKAAK